MANERRGREGGVCVGMRDRWVGESDWRWKAMLGDVVGTRVRGGKSVTRCRSDSENVESSVYISSPNAWASVTTKNENETTKKKLEEIDVSICILSLSLVDFLPAPLLVPDNQTTLLLMSSRPNKDIVQFWRRENQPLSDQHVFCTFGISEGLPTPEQKALKVPERPKAVFPVVCIVPWHFCNLGSVHQ